MDVGVHPVTITNVTGEKDVTSFKANVKVYKHNNRSQRGMYLAERYTLSSKIMEEGIYARIDYPADENGLARSAISAPDGVIIFDRVSKDVLYREQIPEQKLIDEGEDDKEETPRSLFSRSDIEDVKAYFNRLSYRIAENKNQNTLVAETPENFLMESMVYEKVYFDTSLGVPEKYEHKVVDKEGTEITVTEQIVYQEKDGVLTKTGEIITEKYDYPSNIDTSDRAIPALTEDTEAEEITEEELKALEEDGSSTVIYGDIPLGDPGNLDYTETTTVQYEDMELNSLEDAYFKLSL